MISEHDQLKYDYAEPIYETADYDPDYRRTIKAALICVAGAAISGVIYLITKNKFAAAAPFVLISAAISLFNTPLMLTFLYFLFPLETVIHFIQYFSITKAAGLGVVLSFILTRLRFGIVVPSALKWMIVFAVFCLLSALWSLLPLYTAITSLTVFLHVGLMVILVSTIKSVDVFRLILWALLAGCLLSSLLLISGYASPVDTGPHGRATFEDVNPNTIASIFALGVIGAVYLFMKRGFIKKVLLVCMIAIVLAGIFKTQSRSGMLGLFLAVVASFIFSAKKENRLAYIFVAILLCVGGYIGYRAILATDVLGARARERFEFSEYSLESGVRLQFWKDGLEFISERPLYGWGYNNFAIRYGEGFAGGRSAHNVLISITAELGLIGLLILLTVYFKLFRGSLKIVDPRLQCMAFGFLFYNLLNGITHTSYGHKDFWFSIGFVALCILLSQKRNPDEQLYYPPEDYYFEAAH